MSWGEGGMGEDIKGTFGALGRDSTHLVFCVLPYISQPPLQLGWGYVTSSDQ